MTDFLLSFIILVPINQFGFFFVCVFLLTQYLWNLCCFSAFIQQFICNLYMLYLCIYLYMYTYKWIIDWLFCRQWEIFLPQFWSKLKEVYIHMCSIISDWFIDLSHRCVSFTHFKFVMNAKYSVVFVAYASSIHCTICFHDQWSHNVYTLRLFFFLCRWCWTVRIVSYAHVCIVCLDRNERAKKILCGQCHVAIELDFAFHGNIMIIMKQRLQFECNCRNGM